MKTLLRLLGMGGATALLCQCGLVHSIDRSDTEAWNLGVVWKARTGAPTDFLPTDFQGAPLVGVGRGEWVADPQDGYRFYIPAAGTKKFPVGMLRAEVAKATNDYTSRQQQTRNTVRTVLFPVFGAAALFKSETWENSGSGGGGDGGGDSSSYTDTTDNSTSSSKNCHDHNGRDGGRCDASGGHHGK